MVFRVIPVFFLLVMSLLVAGCSNTGMKLSKLAKTDIDMVADIHLYQVDELMRTLTSKLYLRNPRELKKAADMSIENRVTQLFDSAPQTSFQEVDNKKGIEAILLALDPAYDRDRVFALMMGLATMVRGAYGNQSEFFIFDSLDPQKLYNSARNIEVLIWRLKSRVDEHGEPLILTNSLSGEEQNLSFERLFGKLISLQDVMSQIASEKWDRTINFVVQRAATATFLPVGL